MDEAQRRPGLGIVSPELIRSGRRGTVTQGAAPMFACGGLGFETELGIFANPPDTNRIGRDLFEYRRVGVAAIESEQQEPLEPAGVLIEGMAKMDHFLSATQTESGFTSVGAILGPFILWSFGLRLLWCWGVNKGDRSQSIATIVAGNGSGNLEKALSANEVGLEAWTERIATPGDAGCMETGAAKQGVIENGTEGSGCLQLRGDGAADDRKDGPDWKAVMGEEPIRSAPIMELGTGGGEQTRDGMAAEAKQ